MDVALDAFIRKGYERTSMGEIAAAAGVSKPVIYTHFRSKEELYTEVLKRQQAVFAGTIQESVGPRFSTGDPEMTIRSIYEALFRHAAEEPGVCRFLYDEYRDAPVMAVREQEKWREHHLGQMTGFFERIFTRLNESDRRAAGYGVAISVSSIGRHGIRLVLSGPAGRDTDHLAALLAGTVVRGVEGLQSAEGVSRTLGHS
jgi:AcrR family transcriptional regulator